MNRTCLATSFFLPNDQRFYFDKKNIWHIIADSLHRFKIDLCLFSTNKYEQNNAYKNYLIPYNISHYPDIRFPNMFTYPSSFKDKVCVWEKTPFIDDRKINSCSHYISLILDEIQPNIVLCWNVSHPASLILKIESLKRHIPVVGIEKGFFPETITLDAFENSYFADINFNHTIKRQISTTQINNNKIKDVKKYYLNNKTFSKNNIKDPYAIIYVGAYGANILPKTITTNKSTSRNIVDIPSMIDTICKTDKSMQYVLSVHPIDYGFIYSDLKILKAMHKNLILISEADMDMLSLFHFSQYGLFLGSGTTQQEYLLFDKPLVLLSKTALSNKQLCYEYNGKNLLEIMSLAKSGQISDEEKEARHRYMTFLFESYLFGSNDCPTTLKIMDLAEHIHSMC
jgi:hypothetical protein